MLRRDLLKYQPSVQYFCQPLCSTIAFRFECKVEGHLVATQHNRLCPLLDASLLRQLQGSACWVTNDVTCILSHAFIASFTSPLCCRCSCHLLEGRSVWKYTLNTYFAASWWLKNHVVNNDWIHNYSRINNIILTLSRLWRDNSEWIPQRRGSKFT